MKEHQLRRPVNCASHWPLRAAPSERPHLSPLYPGKRTSEASAITSLKGHRRTSSRTVRRAYAAASTHYVASLRSSPARRNGVISAWRSFWWRLRRREHLRPMPVPSRRIEAPDRNDHMFRKGVLAVQTVKATLAAAIAVGILVASLL